MTPHARYACASITNVPAERRPRSAADLSAAPTIAPRMSGTEVNLCATKLTCAGSTAEVLNHRSVTPARIVAPDATSVAKPANNMNDAAIDSARQAGLLSSPIASRHRPEPAPLMSANSCPEVPATFAAQTSGNIAATSGTTGGPRKASAESLMRPQSRYIHASPATKTAALRWAYVAEESLSFAAASASPAKVAAAGSSSAPSSRSCACNAALAAAS
mmetsp:Transcript_17952/g.55719  ORF Transcript_17952/g.55719 Transcript_17952/m.55719 type:complete len:218 (+) Transcript_17952:294-947(+)